MKEKHPIKGSNTFYKVWGIIELVFAGLAGILYLLCFILVIAASSALPDFVTYSVRNTLAGYTVAVAIVFIIFVALDMILRICTGVVLVREYIKSKGAFTALAVIHFVIAFLRLLAMIFSVIAGSAVFIIYFLLCVGWNIATGIILISKSGKADMSKEGDDLTPPDPPLAGRIEGVFGEFEGKQISLHLGLVYKIGRETGCDIQLVHPKVSRVHCTVCLMPNGRYQITDYSFNGTFYENKRLSKNIAEEVNPGGMLVIGEADNVLRLK